MHDLIIRNAQILDGSGADPVAGDVAVSAGRITEVGRITAGLGPAG